MCSRFQSVRLDSDLRFFFQAQWRQPPGELKQDVFPGYTAPFVRRPPELASGDEAVPAREAVAGSFGLLPHWAKDAKLAKSTYNARSETVASKPAFRDPLGIAGLWSRWKPPRGLEVLSFTMLTINADTHPVMCNYHRPDDVKRMIVLLREEDFDAWLDAPPERSMEFMRACAPEELVAISELRP